MAYAVGNIIAPVIGGALKDAYGFRASCDIMGIFATACCVLYGCIEIILKDNENVDEVNAKGSELL
jgi:MFS family permease